MGMLLSLWLPVLVSSIVVFMASFVAWMVLPHHKSDWSKLGKEEEFTAALNSLEVTPGQYMFPYFSDAAEMKSDDFKARWAAGPRGTLSIWAGEPNMGLNLLWTFLFYIVTGIFIAYLGKIGLPAGAAFVDVFRFTTTAAILAHCFGNIPNAIWFKKKGRSVVNDLLDGIVYGVLTGLVFAWLWPTAEAVPQGGGG